MRLSPLLLGGALPGTATTTRCSAEIASGDTEQDFKEASLFPKRDERCLKCLEFFFSVCCECATGSALHDLAAQQEHID